MDRVTREGVVPLMESSQSEVEWNANCDEVKASFHGYPDFWFEAIVGSGLSARVQARWNNPDLVYSEILVTRAEHVAWCKRRAISELSEPDEAQAIANAWSSMVSDLNKHSATEGHAALSLGMMMFVGGRLSTRDAMSKFIEGFN